MLYRGDWKPEMPAGYGDIAPELQIVEIPAKRETPPPPFIIEGILEEMERERKAPPRKRDRLN